MDDSATSFQFLYKLSRVSQTPEQAFHKKSEPTHPYSAHHIPQPNTPQRSHNFLMEKNSIMPNSNGASSFTIHVRDDQESYRGRNSAVSVSPARILSRIRRILMRYVFYFPSRGSSSSATTASKQRNLEKFEPPKTSCSSNYSSYSHYNEAIADCIEFFNKSLQDQIGVEGNRISDVNEIV